MSLVRNSNVAVIGGGISGLSFVYFLSKLRPDLNFTIFERSSRFGGYINTELHNFNGEKIKLEKGPRTLRGASDGTTIMIDTLIKMGHKDVINVIPSNSIANKKYLLSPENELIQVPNSLPSTYNFLRSSLGKGLLPGFLTEIFKPQKLNKKDESVESFLTRRFGKSLPNNIMSAVFNGIYAADISKLSAKTTLKSMYESELQHGSIVKSMLLKSLKFQNKNDDSKKIEISNVLKDYETAFPNSNYKISDLKSLLTKFPMIVLSKGLETFPSLIKENLSKNSKIKFIHNDPIISLTKNQNKLITLTTSSGHSTEFHHVRSTVNASTFAEFLQNGKLMTTGKEDSPTALIAQELKFINIFLVNLYINSNVLKNHGFGYLIPKSNKNNERVLGVIFDSDIEKSSSKLFTEDTFKALTSTNETSEKPKFPEIEPHYDSESQYTKLTIMMGGHYWTNHKIPSRETSIRAAKDALENQLGLDFTKLSQDTDFYIDSLLIPNCLPQFHTGYDELKFKFLESVKNEFGERLSIGGMSFGDGAGVPDCVQNAMKSALKLSK
ncbi:protoporphyrinogen oxidase [Wickerhamomyces ciferrii]|uniref:Protoporphyrinogen oxidase n=1 Tax=Wickerhamomyces ciferrii (strain ATCC 14091 / BCRC 22168 / CBS 111 / JCM 3599 / NBRC 0793 / NRRL Y-1031 F-60-10) TaxID=1206466 RepID=K0KH68_WICCF|nr:protoporphyrinogen oxidase [Wickerhamomyces ciferrii]CCH44560.1 protoporphyrinogen oxidase [Wickerhamomyces ciferrii]